MDLITVVPEAAGGVTAVVRGHRIGLDLAREDGGGDRGASPTEVLAASLGACIALMVGSYCRRHGYSEAEVRVDLTTELGAEPRRVTGIVVDLQVPRDVPPDRRDAIRRIAEACPIHQVLRDSIAIDLELV